MNELEARLRAYVAQLESEAAKHSGVIVKADNKKTCARRCFALFGVLLFVLSLLTLLRERKRNERNS